MITVLSPGARTLVQDAGRPGYEHLGVPTSGAADPTSLRLANLLVGNTATEAAFEIAAHGPSIRFDCEATIAYAGANTDVHLDDMLVPTHHTLRVRAGQVVRIGGLRGGLFGYLSVAGGVDVPHVLGSASSCTLSGLGTTPLTSGTEIAMRDASHRVEDAFIPTSALLDPAASGEALRVLPGPHLDLFDDGTVESFFTTRWSVSALSSRVGVRMDAPTSLTVPEASLPSMGMVRGAIQVPPNGMPIVLGPDHGTVGGYPVIGVVHPDDLPTLMQRISGSAVRFVPTTSANPGTPRALPTVLRNRDMASCV